MSFHTAHILILKTTAKQYVNVELVVSSEPWQPNATYTWFEGIFVMYMYY